MGWLTSRSSSGATRATTRRVAAMRNRRFSSHTNHHARPSANSARIGANGPIGIPAYASCQKARGRTRACSWRKASRPTSPHFSQATKQNPRWGSGLHNLTLQACYHESQEHAGFVPSQAKRYNTGMPLSVQPLGHLPIQPRGVLFSMAKSQSLPPAARHPLPHASPHQSCRTGSAPRIR